MAGVMVQTRNPGTREAEGGRSSFQVQSTLHSKTLSQKNKNKQAKQQKEEDISRKNNYYNCILNGNNFLKSECEKKDELLACN